MIELRGMSWDHPRGHDSAVATADAYMALDPDVSVSWKTRSLQDFADYPIEKLAEMFDLILIDHPFTGFAAASRCLLPVDEYLDASFLEDQAANNVGRSHQSYIYGGHQWALATDAAAQVAAYRPDLLDEIGVAVPRSWPEVFALAERQTGPRGMVATPLIPVDALMCFLSLCAHLGEEAFQRDDVVVGRATGREALAMLKRLHAGSHPESTTWNPIRCLERMSTTDEIAYVPLAFGYSNYARPGFRDKLVKFTNVPRAADGVARGGILGGVGLAVSAKCANPEAAFAYARFVASAEVQRGVYFEGGGQPGHRSAWIDPGVNAASSNYFLDTLESLDNCYLRPRYNGYMEVQDRGFAVAFAFLTEHGDIERTLDEFDALYRGSNKDVAGE